jgi:hypothetical protein
MHLLLAHCNLLYPRAMFRKLTLDGSCHSPGPVMSTTTYHEVLIFYEEEYVHLKSVNLVFESQVHYFAGVATTNSHKWVT